ncbi:MAG: DUF4292 domain-containing protein [Bacteroidetes bacterium]|nr:DUF4292 domain-containing protein [Bacteroidota bacterium]
MKKLSLAVFLFLFSVSLSAQEIDEAYSGANDTENKILDIMKEVNRKYELTDNILSEGEVKIKAPGGVDESASIEIRAKKKNDLWFKIDGPLGVDVATAYFGRTNFTYLNSLNDYSITGPTNFANISAVTRMRAYYDDLMNAFTGTVKIVKFKNDALELQELGGTNVLIFKTTDDKGIVIQRKYYVDKTTYVVSKVEFCNIAGQVQSSISFSNIVNNGDGWYAKTVDASNPKKGEYVKLIIEKFHTNQPNLSFYVNIPSGVKKKVWKN